MCTKTNICSSSSLDVTDFSPDSKQFKLCKRERKAVYKGIAREITFYCTKKKSGFKVPRLPSRVLVKAGWSECREV
jgi:hypothetical protein